MAATTDLWTERVLVCVELVPCGRVAAYGDIGGIVGRGPRWVGRVLAEHGADVPWWRVPNAAGRFPEPLLHRAYDHWRAEGIALTADGRGCRIAAHRADLMALAAAYERRMAAVLAEAGLALPPLAAPARRALAGVGVRALEELTEHPRSEVAALHGMGPRALSALDAALAGAELAYGGEPRP